MKSLLETKLESMSDVELMQLFNDMQSPTIEYDSPVRELCTNYFGYGILLLQVQQLIWPVFTVMATRFDTYSRQILPR